MTKEVRSDSVPYQLFMLVLSIYTLLALGLNAILRPTGQTQMLIEYADRTICVFFLIDFLVCLYRAPNKLRYMYTWGWLDLLSSIPMIDAARWGRLARAARIFRVLRGIRSSRIIANILLAKRAESAFLAVGLFAILLLVAASISILQVETASESNIKTAGDALWWALTTITTVGYGDHFPVTSEGRFIAGVLMCAGVGLFGMFSGFLTAWFVAPSSSREHADLVALKDELRQLRSALENAGNSQRTQSN